MKMQVVNFIKKQLNFSKKWAVTAIAKGEMLSSDALTARLMCKHGYRRKDIHDMTTKIKDEIMEELLSGNSIDLFGLVKIRADFSLRNKFVGSESEAEQMANQLSEHDVKPMVKANINQAFNHEYVKSFTSRRRKLVARCYET